MVYASGNMEPVSQEKLGAPGVTTTAGWTGPLRCRAIIVSYLGRVDKTYCYAPSKALAEPIIIGFALFSRNNI